MKQIVLATLLFTCLQSYSQEAAKQVYESTNLKQEISKHKLVAILPFEAGITGVNLKILMLLLIKKTKKNFLKIYKMKCLLSCLEKKKIIVLIFKTQIK